MCENSLNTKQMSKKITNNLEISNLCINTHTHTHTHTQFPLYNKIISQIAHFRAVSEIVSRNLRCGLILYVFTQ